MRAELRARLGPVALAALASLHAASYLGAGPHDDEFIVHRYARHLVEGQGLVFNPPERVEGFSAPGWTLLHAAGLALGLPPTTTALVLSILAAGVATWAVGELWLRLLPAQPRGRWPVPALLLVPLPAFAWHAVAGLGTSLLAALLALWCLTYESEQRRGRPAWGAAAWLAAACLLRQECALFALPFACSEWRARRPLPALLPLASLAGWTIFRWLYYGRLLPVSWSVKKLPPAVDLAYGIEYLALSTLECGIGLAALAALWAPLGASRALRCARAGMLLFVGFVVWVGGDYMPLARFFVPLLPIAFLLGALGLRARLAPRADTQLAAVLVALLAFQWTQRERPQLFGEQRFFVERWAALGRHFGRVLPGDAAVALSPIGAFGWHSRLPIVDLLGLTNERVLEAAPDLSITMKGHHRHDAEWVLGERPAALILFNGVFQPHLGRWVVNPWERDLYEHPRFAAEYAAVTTAIEGSDPLLFYWRGDLPLPEGALRAEAAGG